MKEYHDKETPSTRIQKQIVRSEKNGIRRDQCGGGYRVRKRPTPYHGR